MKTNSHAHHRAIGCVALVLANAAIAIAQDGPDPRLQKVDRFATKTLISYGRRAEGMKLPSLARRAYAIVLDHYDAEQPTALRGLGFVKTKDGWIESGKPVVADVENASKRKSLARLWQKISKTIGERHGKLGLLLRGEGELAAGNEQLERALSFCPGVRAWHEALGHVAFEGFFGNDEQLAFAKRFREIRDRASELAAKSYDVAALGQGSMPVVLQRSGLPFVGGTSKHFTHWLVGKPEEVRESLQWAERSFELLQFLAGSHMPRGSHRWVSWHALLRNNKQRDALLANSPKTRGSHTLEQAKLFGGTSFREGVGWATASWNSLEHMADSVVAHVVQRHFCGNRNSAMTEGLMHTCTWLLCGSTRTYYARLPHTVTKGYKPMKRLPENWRKRLFDEIDSNSDWQLDQLPRERTDNFRDSVRIKAWSFMAFLVARHPEQWAVLYDKMGTSDNLLPETVAERFEQHLERRIGEVDEEWREWAKKDSRLGKVTGW